MFPLLLTATGLVLVLAPLTAWTRYRDPFHPLLYLCPLFFYSYVYRPGLLQWRRLLDAYFWPDQLVWVAAVNLLGLAVFCWGALSVRRSRTEPVSRSTTIDLSPPARSALVTLASWFGFIGVTAFFVTVRNAGGLEQAYGHAKGGAAAESGYLGEAPLLTLPAILMLFMAWRGTRMSVGRWALVILFASPNLIQGFLGTRRGPTFLVLATLLFATYVRSNRSATPVRVLAGLGGIGLVVLFLFSHRSEIYVGSNFRVDQGRFGETLAPTELSAGDEWVHGAGLMVTSRQSRFHHWGKRLLTVVFVRPIPRQIWPTKYEDVGMGWMLDEAYLGGLTVSEWLGAVRWMPYAGASSGFIADLFLEFSYGLLVVTFLFGRFYGALWKRFRVVGGVSTLIYFFAAVLSIYVPTQSFSAWLHRFLIMSVPTLVLWHYVVAPRERRWLRRAGRSMAPDGRVAVG
jgi:hypothetical protein